MIVAEKISQVRQQVKIWKSQGFTVGLVPTMGYLHEGHTSLVDTASANCDKTVVSVFVNPTQFSPSEDLDTYPRDFARDAKLLEQHGCDMVFHPDVDEMYPGGKGTTDTYVEMHGAITENLCGITRPDMFRGVCTVVSKLFNIVTPDKAFFGEKDAQQLAVIKKMVRDMSYGIEIIGCPIVRESDGLAKSSRNTYLNDEERKAAVVLYKSLQLGKKLIKGGEQSADKVLRQMTDLIESEHLAKIDYVSCVNGITMEPVETIERGNLIAVAVYIGKARLIDNFTVNI